MAKNSTNRARQCEEAEDIGSNASANPTIGDIIALRLSRRDLMSGLLAVSAVSLALPPGSFAPPAAAEAAEKRATPSFHFAEVAAGSDETHHVADGYDADILIRWGDGVLRDAPLFDPVKQAADAQARQFGYNNDFLGFIPIDGRPIMAFSWSTTSSRTRS